MENITEKLYEDFTTKLLPKIAEGLVVSKDYFTDLFGRYVKYLLVSDTIRLLFAMLLLFTAYKIIRRGQQWYSTERYADNFPSVALWMIGGFIIFFGFIEFGISANNIAKDIYIPEVRIYEKLNTASLK